MPASRPRFVWALASLCLVVGLAASGFSQPNNPADPLGPVSESLAASYRNGQFAELFRWTERFGPRLTSEDGAELDRRLAAQQLPALGIMLLEARVAGVNAGQPFLSPKPTSAEAAWILTAFPKQLETLAQELKASPALTVRTAPAQLREYEPLLTQLQRDQQQAGGAKKLGELVSELLRSHRRALTKALGPEFPAAAKRLQEAQDTIAALHTLTQEQEISLRVQRLGLAVRTLQATGPLTERFRAALALDYDGPWLEQLFAARSRNSRSEPFSIASLNHAELPAKVRELTAQGRESAGDLLDKAHMLNVGIQWWLRGRYGWGTQFYGLVKSPAAGKDPYREVSVPEEYPTSDSDQQQSYPERRHYYTWTWEERQLQMRRYQTAGARPAPRTPVTGSPAPRTPVPVVTVPLKPISGARGISGKPVRRGGGSGTRFGGSGGLAINLPYGQTYGPIDRPYSFTIEDVYKKLNGGKYYKDYQKRQQRLAQLPKQAPYPNRRGPGYQRPAGTGGAGDEKSPGDQQPQQTVVTYTETYIGKQDPNLIYRLIGFIEYQNALQCFDWLCTHITEAERAAIDQILSERPELQIEVHLAEQINHPASKLAAPPGVAKDQRGLTYLTALARTEVGCMLAAFAGQPIALAQLAVAYDEAAYRELVTDAAKAHYWSLLADPELAAIMARNGGVTRTLAYSRRALLAQSLVTTAAQLQREHFDQEQLAELGQWSQNLRRLQERLDKVLKSYQQRDVRVDAR